MVYALQIVSFILLILSSTSKSAKNSMLMQALSCAATGAASFFVGAVTGGVTAIIGFVRTMIFKRRDKFSAKQYTYQLIAFQILNLLTAVFTFTSWFSLLPLINTLLRTHCLWTNNLKLIKWSALEMGIVLGIYYTIYGAYFLTLGYVIVTIITIFSLIKDAKEKSLLA